MPHLVSSKVVEVDGRVLDAGDIFWGASIIATSGGTADFTLYDGIDSGGELLEKLTIAASSGGRVGYPFGIVLQRGLYVDIGSNVSLCRIHYQLGPAFPNPA